VIPPAIFFYYSTLFDSRFKTLQQNRESLDSFASPHYLPGDVKPVDRIMIKGLNQDHSEWAYISRNLKYRLRKLLKEESQNDELTNHLRETFKESANDLKIELDTWLLGLDVTEK
ncbi:hypothetical protein ABI004_14125, partial [Enterococcus faecium]